MSGRLYNCLRGRNEKRLDNLLRILSHGLTILPLQSVRMCKIETAEGIWRANFLPYKTETSTWHDVYDCVTVF